MFSICQSCGSENHCYLPKGKIFPLTFMICSYGFKDRTYKGDVETGKPPTVNNVGGCMSLTEVNSNLGLYAG